MNLAMADVRVLSRAFERFYKNKDESGLEKYSATCLRRVWKGQRFSWWMTQMLHRYRGGEFDDYDMKRQVADLDYLTSSATAAKSLAEQYVGLPLD